MFTSARQGCAKSLAPTLARPSWSLALHAESSAQALRRTISARQSAVKLHAPLPQIRQAHTRARFSAAAAAVLSHDQQDIQDTTLYEEDDLQIPSPRQFNQDSSTAQLDNNADLDEPLPRRPRQIRASQGPIETAEPPLAKFRRSATSDPLSSLLILPFLPPDQLSKLTLLEIDLLLSSLHNSLIASPPPPVDADDIRSALVQLRGAIHDHPSGQFPGDKMRNKRLYRFLRVALLLDDRDLVRSVWKERIEEQIQRKQRMVQPDRFVQILADDLRDWRMILWMFDPRLYPLEYYTPTVLERYIQAKIATRQPEAVPRLFGLYAETGLKPTKEAHNHLVQALLELGDMDGARLAAQKARTEGGLTADMQQLAILRGHRALGGTLELEDKVLSDVDKLGLAPEAKLVNALIRLRMEDGDLDGAESLLGYFGLGDASGKGTVQPTGDSMFLAMKVASQKKDLDRVGRIWISLCAEPREILDAHLGVLVSALCHAGRSVEAYNVVVSRSTTSSFSIPSTIKPGIRTLNALLSGLPNTDLDDIQRTLELFPQYNIQPDQRTSSILLSLLEKSRHPPEELATFLTSLIEQHPHLRPEVSHLETILSSTLRRQRSTLSTSSSSSTSAGAGLIALEPLHRALRSISQSLSSRSIPSGSKTLALRLRYDALSHGLSGGFPSAEAVWSSLLERGFRPDKRHILALMAGYADSGAMAESAQILSLAKELEIEPTNAMWMTLLIGWARAGDIIRSVAAYRQICNGPNGDGADITAITAMIRAYHICRVYDKASYLVFSSLIPRFSDNLDKQALSVATEALRSDNHELDALDLVREQIERRPELMGRKLRVVVKQIKGWIGKKYGEGPDKERGLRVCEEILSRGGGREMGRKRVKKGILESLGKGRKLTDLI